MIRIGQGALAALMALGMALPSAAEGTCGERETIVAELERFGETRRSIGLQHGGGIVELWVSDHTGSWTILATDTAGRTCMIAAGEAVATERTTLAGSPA